MNHPNCPFQGKLLFLKMSVNKSLYVTGQGIDDIRTKVTVEIDKLEDGKDKGERVAWIGVYEDDGKPRKIGRVYVKSDSDVVTLHTRYGFCYLCTKFLKNSLTTHFRSKHEGMSLPQKEANLKSWCDEVRRLGESMVENAVLHTVDDLVSWVSEIGTFTFTLP